ncbi:MAG: glycosyltransferase family 39 protein [Parcubacteria group bacterium]
MSIRSHWQSIKTWAPPVVLVLLFVGVFGVAGFSAYRSISSFDGAMNLQVPVNLIEHGQYATSYTQTTLFDHRIQTGPTVLVPIALFMAIFGKSFFVANLVSLAYLFGLFIVIFLFVRKLVGRWWAILALPVVFVIPSFLNIALNQFGEIPALFFALSSALMLDRLAKTSLTTPHNKTRLIIFAGLLLGCSVLTKTVMLITVPGFVAVALLDLWLTKRVSLRYYLLFFATAVIPFVFFELYKLSVLGFGAYREWWTTEFTAVSNQAGVTQGMSDTPGLFSKFAEHFRLLGGHFDAPLLVLAAMLILTLVVVAIKLWQLYRDRTQFNWPLSYFTFASIAFSYFGWWLLITPTARAWHRRILDGFVLEEILLVVAIAMLIAIVRRTQGYKKWLAAGAAGISSLCLLTQIAIFAPRVQAQIQPSSVGQAVRHFAELIRVLPQDAVIYGTGWWQSPRLSFLSGRTFTSINHRPPPQGPLDKAYFVIEREAYALSREEMERVILQTKAHLVESVNTGDGYYFLYQLSSYSRP